MELELPGQEVLVHELKFPYKLVSKYHKINHSEKN